MFTGQTLHSLLAPSADAEAVGLPARGPAAPQGECVLTVRQAQLCTLSVEPLSCTRAVSRSQASAMLTRCEDGGAACLAVYSKLSWLLTLETEHTHGPRSSDFISLRAGSRSRRSPGHRLRTLCPA